jgi:lipid-A-disaccharide synthase
LTPTPKTLFIACGEPSGETYAARAARAFRRRFPDAPMEGIGSARLAGEGVRLILDYGSISVVGVTEVVRHLPAVFRALRAAVRRATRPDVGAVLLVDFPDFNFRVGKRANASGVPVVYFVPPQLWAWRRGRAKELARFTKGVVVAFPFEETLLRESGVNARFAGHPLLDELGPLLDAPPDPARFGIPEGKTLVGLLPGSRPGEIRAHLPAMAEAARRIALRFPEVHFAVPLASPGFRGLVASELAASGGGFPVTVVERERHLLFRGMATALAASGTATLELALLGVPPVIVYRTSAVTYWIGRRLASVSSIGLPNILAGEAFLPELIHDACRPDRMAGEIESLLADGARREALAARCVALRGRLRGPGCAEAVVDMLAAAGGEAWG